jgi:hypothetical protein
MDTSNHNTNLGRHLNQLPPTLQSLPLRTAEVGRPPQTPCHTQDINSSINSSINRILPGLPHSTA